MGVCCAELVQKLCKIVYEYCWGKVVPKKCFFIMTTHHQVHLLSPLASLYDCNSELPRHPQCNLYQLCLISQFHGILCVDRLKSDKNVTQAKSTVMKSKNCSENFFIDGVRCKGISISLERGMMEFVLKNSKAILI